MYLVGLTGGIGSGKSTVAARFDTLGGHVIDADQVAREIVRPGEPALDDLVERFGPDILTDEGTLDRPAVAAIVFGDEAARRDLNAITHPRIRARIAAEVVEHARAEAHEARDRVVIVDHPLLVETGQTEDFPAVVVVVAPPAIRLARLVERGVDASDARARMAAQASDEERRAAATHVIDNGGDLVSLHAQVDQVWADLRATADANADR